MTRHPPWPPRIVWPNEERHSRRPAGLTCTVLSMVLTRHLSLHVLLLDQNPSLALRAAPSRALPCLHPEGFLWATWLPGLLGLLLTLALDIPRV